MTGDREAELAVLHARIRDRVDTSKKLVASVRDRARDHRDRALTGFTAAERQLDHIADGLPALYRLAATPEKDGADDLFGVVLAAARSVYPGCDATSVTTIAQSSRPTSTTRRCGGRGRASAGSHAAPGYGRRCPSGCRGRTAGSAR